MARKVDISLIKELNAGVEKQVVGKVVIKKTEVKQKYMNIDECKEYLRNWGKDKKE